MLHRLDGEAPETFPTLTLRDEKGEPHSTEVQPGETVDVVAVDGEEGAAVIHARLVPVDAKAAKKSKPASEAPQEA